MLTLVSSCIQLEENENIQKQRSKRRAWVTETRPDVEEKRIPAFTSHRYLRRLAHNNGGILIG
jgi:hypothetical protein